MSYHTGIGDSFMISGARPRRQLFLHFVKYYPIWFGLFITTIVAVSTIRFAPSPTLAWIGFYWLYQGILYLGRKYRIFEGSQLFQLAHSVLLILSISIFIGYLYRYTNYLEQSNGTDTLWLLYILAIFVMSRYGSTGLMLVITLLSSLALSLIYVITNPNWTLSLVPDIVVKILWLSLLAAVIHILTRVINDRSASLNLLYSIQKEVMETDSMADENRLFDAVVKSVRSNFRYPYVNVFELQTDGKIKCVASASKEGQDLIQGDFSLAPGTRSIITHVIETGESYFTNDVKNCPYYLKHETFSATQSELVVPIKLSTRLIGVIDIQDRRKSAFLEQDRETMESLADYIGKVLDNLRLVKSIQQAIESIARRFLLHHELASTLDEIARAAYEELKADLVILYEYNLLNNAITVGSVMGEFVEPKYFIETVNRTSHLVLRLLSLKEDSYFHKDVQAESANPIFKPDRDYPDCNYPSFIEREKLVSRAIICLRVAGNPMGVMFLNFRSPRNFNMYEERRFRIFADLAALAIHSSQMQQQQMQTERKRLSWFLHDEISSKLFGLSRYISAMLSDQNLNEQFRIKLKKIQTVIQELRRNTRYLYGTDRDMHSGDMYKEIEKIVEWARDIYGATIGVMWKECNDIVFPPIVVYHLKCILSEAILNAINHGDATEIDITFNKSDDLLIMTIEDNGHGFDPVFIDPSGLETMRERTRLVGGDCTVSSSPSTSTCIKVSMPYHMYRGGYDGDG